MTQISYEIDNKIFSFSVKNSPTFQYGKHEWLSNANNDITFYQEWYERGYSVEKFLDDSAFQYLKQILTQSVADIVRTKTGKDVSGFFLENYHNYVESDKLHYEIITITRDLFPEDLNLSMRDIIFKFGELLGFELTDLDPDSGQRVKIMLRVNRPASADFNPPHKDVYVQFDKNLCVPRFINIWLPISGVTQNSSLPVAPGSNLLPEDKILRTFEGGVLNGKKYSVSTIKEWDGKNNLIRPQINDGDVLFFTPHLIHGLALNEEDKTRMSLEFRLYKKAK